VRFVDADNATELYFEVESFSATTNDTVMWVNVPQIDSGSTTDYIWIYYGNSTCAFDSYYNSVSVWNSNYVLVLHLNETSGVPIDSKGLQTSSVNTAQQGVSGILGTSYNFTSQYFNVTNTASLSGMATLSLEFWTYKTKAQAERTISIHDNAGLKLYHVQTYLDGVSNCSLYGSINNVQYGTAYNVVPLNQWNYIVQRYDGSNIIGYVNNGQVYTGAKTGSVGTTSRPLVVGRNPTTLTSYFSGKLDEIRISNVSRSAAWYSACYQYMKDQTKFTVAAEEPSSTLGSSSGGASLLWTFARYATVPASFALQTLTSGLAQFVNLAGSVMMSLVAAFSSGSVFSRFSSLSEVFSVTRVSGITKAVGGAVAESFSVLGARATVLSRSLGLTASFMVSGLDGMVFSRFGIAPLSLAINSLKAVSAATARSIAASFSVASVRLDSLLRFGSASLSTALSGTRSLLESVGGVVAEAFDVGTLRSWTVLKYALTPVAMTVQGVASGFFGRIFTLYSSIPLILASASNRVLSIIRQGNVAEALTFNTVHTLTFLKGGLASLGASVSNVPSFVQSIGGSVLEAFAVSSSRLVTMLGLGSISEAFAVGASRYLAVLRYGLTPLTTTLSSLAEGLLRTLNLYGLIPESFIAEASKAMAMFDLGSVTQILGALGLKAATVLKASELASVFAITKLTSGLPSLLTFFGNILASFNLGSIGSTFMPPYGAGVGDLAMTFFSVAIVMPLILALYVVRRRKRLEPANQL
jgi:hypothetical protein